MSAPTVVLLHGFTHTGASWNPMIRALGERYKAIAPDLRGHGRSADIEPLTLDAVVGDVAELIPAGAPTTLVGYSMGGRIALHVALALGGQIDRLVLIGASPGLADRAERAERVRSDERLAEWMEKASIEEVASRWASGTPVLAGQPDRVRAAVHVDRLRNTVSGLARALRGLGTGTLPSLWDRLGELTMPVALVVGERDAKFRGIAEAMAALMAAADLVVVPGAGHAVHLEAPEAIARVIDE